MMKKITLMFSLFFACFWGQVHAQTSPANDDLANAIPLIMGASCTNDFFTNEGATAETDEPMGSCFTGATHTVWFSFTAPASGAVEVTTDILPGDMGDSQIAIYPAPSDLSDLSTLPAEVGCDQDGGEVVFNGTSTYMSVLETGGLTPDDTYYIQVDGWNGETGDFCIEVSEVTCPEPTNLSASNIFASSAELDWTENGMATVWDIEFGPAGFSPSGTPTYNDISKPYSVTGLTNLTSYEFYVRADCGGGDVSDWVGPIGFTTACVGLPFVETFDDAGLPTCWTMSGATDWDFSTGAGYAASDADDHTPGGGTNYAWVDASSPFGQGDTNTLTSPAVGGVASLSSPLLEFYLFSDNTNSSDISIIDVEFFDGAVWNNVLHVDTLLGDSWMQYVIDLSTYNITGPVQVRFTITGGNSFYNDVLLDDVSIYQPQTCMQPSNLTTTSITATSADFGWTENNTPAATVWDIYVVPAGDPAPTSTTTPTNAGVTSNPFNVTGLTALTDYDLYVRSDCGGGDVSYWSGPSTFTTACGAYSLPFVETFDDSDTPTCWEESGDNSWDFSTSAGYAATSVDDHTPGGGTDYAWMDGSDNGDGEVSTLTSPLVDISSLTTPAVEFYLFSNNDDSSAINIIDVEFYDGAAWNNILNVNTLLGPDWVGYLIDLSSYTITGDVQVRFTITGNDNGGSAFHNDILLDDVSFMEYPSCFKPTALTVASASITATSADLSWTDNNTPAATTWDVHIVPAGDPVPTSTTTPTNAGVTSNPFNATGLNSSTDYDFYVRSNCGGGDLSVWAGPYTFTTACAPSSNFYENFDTAATGSMPNCWSSLVNSSSSFASAEVDDDSGDAHSGSNYIEFYNSSDTAAEGYAITPALMDLPVGTHQIRFFAKGDTGSSIEVGTMSDPTDETTFTSVQTITLTESYQQYMVPFTASTTDAYVALKTLFGATYDYVEVDDVYWEMIPTCPGPTGLTVGNITNTSADLSWTESGTATIWDVHIVPAGSSVPTNTTTPSNPGITTNNPYTVTNLSQCVAYEFYVRADCGGGDVSQWTGPVGFSLTGTGTITAPYTETFENGGSIPNCWAQGASNLEDWEFDDSVGLNHIGNNGDFYGTSSASGGYFAWVDDSSPNNTGTTLESPNVDVSGLTAPVLSFYYVSDNEGNTNVDFSVDFYDGAAWNTAVFTSNNNTGGWTKVYIDLSTYTISGPVKARFIVDENNGSDFYDDLAIDDVSFDEMPTCLPPTGLTAMSITDTTADLGWTDGNTPPASIWDIEIVPAGTPRTGTPTAIGVSNPYNATNLTPLTSYDFYVRASCGGGDVSDWAGPYNFTTDCGTFSSPFLESFADSSTPNCWTEGGDEAWDYSLSADYDAASVPDHTPGGGTNHAWIDDSSLADGETASLTSPLVDVSTLANPVLEFYLFSSNSDDSTFNTVEVEFYDGAAWNTILTVNSSLGPDFVRFIFDLNMFNITGDVQVRFTFTGASGGFYNDILLDDVAFMENPCPAPTALTVNGTTDTTADLSWTPGGNETTWEIEYGPVGFAAGTGTVVVDTDGVPNTTVANLVPETDYDVYVRAVCTEVTSTVGPETFTTGVLVCPDVTNISIVDVTETSFEVTWTAGGAETVWKIEYGPEGFTPGTGIVVIDDDGIGEVIIGLDPEKNYEVYVTAICDGYDGTNVGPEAFDTFLGIENQLFENFSFYPNPVSGQLYLKANSQIQKVVIYNLLGQEIMTLSPDSLSPTLNLSNLQMGTYLMQVTIKGSKGVYKILKE